MAEYIKLELKSELIEMCKAHIWFTGGSTEAYEKMLNAAENLKTKEIAFMIRGA